MSWTKPKPKPKTKLVNHIALVLDASPSMDRIKQDALTAFNSEIDAIVDCALADKENVTTLDIVLFNTTSTHLRKSIVIEDKNKKGKAALKKLLHINDKEYALTGATALVDSVCYTIKYFEELPDAHLPNVSFLVKVITDGQENSSKLNHTNLRTSITEAKATDRFTIGFQIPLDSYFTTAKSALGLLDDEVRGWEVSGKGIAAAASVNNVAFSNYYATRSAGMTSMSSGLYSTDIPSASSIKQDTSTVTSECKVGTVSKETDIKSWYERTYKGVYRKGICFYQLTKREKIQEYKEILLLDKKTNTIRHANTRALLGVPETGDIKVEPGNHGNYDIFVQSTSSNRILVRGSKVIVWTNAPVKAKLGVV